MNPLTQSKNATILPVLIALALGCFGLSPQARAVCQEGCDLSNAKTTTPPSSARSLLTVAASLLRPSLIKISGGQTEAASGFLTHTIKGY
jgi:hypothetical protein